MGKLKILFQEPFVPRGVTFGRFSSGAGNNTFHYGLACIASYVKEREYDVSYLDPAIEKMSEDRYLAYLQAGKFDVIGISSTTLQIEHALECFALIKRHFPDVITVLGGVHATLLPEETIRSARAIDYLVLGEGEKPFLKLLDALAQGRKERIREIAGICCRENGALVVNQPDFKNYLTAKEIPVPLFDIFPMRKYVPQITYAKAFPTYSLVASRGCPFRCAFCNATDISGRRVRYKRVDVLLREIAILKEVYGARGIMFLDSTFTVNKNWVKEFCEKYIRSGLKLPWACNSRVDTIDRELLLLMKESGCWTILFGIESGNQKSLDSIRKGTTVEQNTQAIEMCLDLGYYVYTSYILCLPGETEEDVLNTIAYAREMGNHLAMFYLPVPYPKTRLWEICKETGGLREEARWSDFNAWDYRNPVYINPLLGKNAMLRLYRKAFLSFYSNPKVWWRNAQELFLMRQSPYKYWLGLKGLIGSFLHR